MKRVVAREQQVVGTYDDATLVALLNAGTLKLTDQHWDATTSTWRPLTDFIGQAARQRDYSASLARMSVLMLTAACGATATWWVMRDLDTASAAISATLGMTPARSTPKTTVPSVLPVTETDPALSQPASPSAENASQKKHPSEVLALLNVEVFDGEVAVTVQNNGSEPVDGFDLKLAYFDLPGDRLIVDSNAKTIAAIESSTEDRKARLKSLEEEIKALGLHLKLVSTDVITWTPSHIKALPDAELWAAFGNKPLAEAGAAAKAVATAFAEGASSINPKTRQQALTGHLLVLARKLDDLRPMIQACIDERAALVTKLNVEHREAAEKLADLQRRQQELQSGLASKMDAARRNPARIEITHVDRVIEHDLVQRITVKRQPGERQSVWVELARPDDKAVAVNLVR